MDSILRQMNNDGINPPTPLIPDGKVHRFSLDSNDKKQSGWYRGYVNATANHGDFYVFIYGDHHYDGYFTAQSNAKIDKHDKARMQEVIRKAQRAHHHEKTQLQEKTKQEAQEKWEKLSNEFGKNPYLEKKGITQLFGARLDGFHLSVPMRDIDGVLWNIETIYFDGTSKKGMFGGRREKLFHMIGEIKDIIYFCEGFATSIAVHLAMQDAVVCAFGSGNLPKVAAEFSKKYPDKRIVVCGDNNQYTENNVGAVKAIEAANLAGGKYIIPKFNNLETKPKDFDDLMRLSGLDEVRNQILGIEPKLEVATFDESYVINSPYPDENPHNMKRKGTIRNLSELLKRLRVIVRYNVITKREEIIIPQASFTIDNYANASFAYVLDWCERVSIPNANMKSYITAIADTNLHNPVATWIESKPWDGVSRLQEFFATIRAKDELENGEVLCMKEKLIKTWLVSCIAAAFEPNGVSAHGVLVLQGDQYLGKTAWFKRLAPKSLGVIRDGLILRPDDKDSVMGANCNWIVELGELDATFRKSDIAQLKAFLTKDRDMIRRPFAPLESEYARRTIYCASVNDHDFLRDTSGNRRFWTIACEYIDFDHDVDMQQLWAEVLVLYKAGAPWVLSKDEVESLNMHNDDFMPVDPIFERISTYFPWEGPNGGLAMMNATQVCIAMGILNPKRSEQSDAGRALKKMGLKHDRNKKYCVPQRFPILFP